MRSWPLRRTTPSPTASPPRSSPRRSRTCAGRFGRRTSASAASPASKTAPSHAARSARCSLCPTPRCGAGSASSWSSSTSSRSKQVRADRARRRATGSWSGRPSPSRSWGFSGPRASPSGSSRPREYPPLRQYPPQGRDGFHPRKKKEMAQTRHFATETSKPVCQRRTSAFSPSSRTTSTCASPPHGRALPGRRAGVLDVVEERAWP